MKKEDLMIGDWVQITHHHNPKPIVKVKRVDLTDFCDALKQIYPRISYASIPLTQEILEKNGFKKVEKDLFHLGQSSIGVDTWFGIDNNVIYVDALYHDAEIAFCKCEYVHELQHILKDLGIEKYIVL